MSRMEDARWSAVLGRVPSAAFVYAVTSTGIYCRPDCPSRRPRRANVRFFARGSEAEAAGFRACLRCAPAQAPARVRLVERVVAAIDQALEDGERLPTLGVLAARLGMSPFHLQRSFRAAVGLSPKAFADARRAGRLRRALKAGRRVDEAGLEAGYGSSRSLYEAGRRALGEAPGRFRDEGGEVRFTSVDSALGPLFLARGSRGIRSVELGAGGEAAILARWPGALRDDADAQLRAWMARIVRGLDASTPSTDLPLEVKATAFQWRVWRALQQSRAGETFTYASLAEQLGMRSGARAVARACASNPVALVVPCHRVVRKDGDLGGYRWGVERKAQLLARERG